MKTKVHLLLLITVVFWGTSFAVSKIGMGKLNPIHFLFLRLLICSIVFVMILSLIDQSKRKISRTDIPKLIFLAFVGISGYFIVQYTALKYTSTINAALLIGTSPIFVAIYTHLIGRESLNKQKMVGIGLSFLGMGLVITKGSLLISISGKSLVGDLLMVLNVLMLSIFTINAKNILQKYDPFVAVAYINIIALIILCPLVFTRNVFSEKSFLEVFKDIQLVTLFSAAYLAVFCSVIGYYGWYRGIKEIGSTKTAVFNYINPLVAAITSIIFFNEPISYYTIGGGILVILGVYLSNKQSGSQSTYLKELEQESLEIITGGRSSN